MLQGDAIAIVAAFSCSEHRRPLPHENTPWISAPARLEAWIQPEQPCAAASRSGASTAPALQRQPRTRGWSPARSANQSRLDRLQPTSKLALRGDSLSLGTNLRQHDWMRLLAGNLWGKTSVTYASRGCGFASSSFPAASTGMRAHATTAQIRALDIGALRTLHRDTIFLVWHRLVSRHPADPPISLGKSHKRRSTFCKSDF